MRLPNGYGSVHKLSGNRRNPWRVRKMIDVTEDGKSIYTNIGYFDTRKKALEALAEFNKNPYDVANNKVTFKEVYDLMFERLSNTLSESSSKDMKSVSKHLISLYNKRIKDIRTHDLQSVIDNMEVGLSMKKKAKSLLNKTFKYASENDIVIKDYSKFVKIIDTGTGKTVKRIIFTSEEIRSIFSINDFDHDIVKILLCTGFRINELLTLRTENIHLEENYLVGGSKTGAGIDRTVPISRHIKHIIEKYYNTENEFLFVNKKGKAFPYQTFINHWQKILPNHTPHDTRHTVVSIYDNITVNKVAMHRIIGHADESITEKVYTHKSIEDLQEVMSAFDDYFEKLVY